MHWVGFALLVAASAVGLRWMFTRIDSLGRRRPFPTASVAILVLLGCAAFVPFILRLRLEAKLSDAASVLVGERVSVRCQSFGEAFVDAGAELGYVAFGPDGVPEKRTLIKRAQCADLSDYLGPGKAAPALEHVVAVHTVTHEAMHMRGLTDEAETECAALQRNAQTARLLGASEEQARALAAAYWANVYPRMPAGYRSEECRPGGRLDEGLEGAPWLQ